MAMEVRYIIFTLHEAREAILGLVSKEGHAGPSSEIVGMRINGGAQLAVSVDIRIRTPIAAKTINLASDRVVVALLLYCKGHRIPVPRRAQKLLERSNNGLTLVLTTDLEPRNPVITRNHVSYTAIDNYAEETSQAKQELARALEYAESAHSMIEQANARAKTAETAAAEATARLGAITPNPPRGLVRRLLSTLAKT